MSKSPLGPLLLRMLLPLSLHAGCGGATTPGEDAGEIAADTFLLRLPGMAARDRLQAELARRGIAIQHAYSDIVGLGDTISIRASAAEVQGILAALPLPIEARAAVLRYPHAAECGNGACEGEEAQTLVRATVCSYDCGVPAPRALRDELDNAWHVRTVGADRAWAEARGEGIHVAVLDTGYDKGPASTHPDRPEHLGFGYNFATGSPDYSAVAEHGTHVAGIVAAPRNGFGTVGVAPAATVHAFQVFRRVNGRTVAADSEIIAAIEAAIRNGYHIINMSLGGGRDSELEHLAVRKAFDAGLLVVVSAGNAEDYGSGSVVTAPRNFPGAYQESFSVGATSRADAIAGFSSTGPTVTVSAPGLSVYSTVPRGTGESDTQVVFDGIQPGAPRPLQATTPFGASVTPVVLAPIAACGFGAAAEVDRCAPVGKMALIQRGPIGEGATPISFVEKIENARSRGALGVILYNHRGGDPATAGGLFGADIGTGQPVPVIAMAAGDGERIARAILSGAPVRVSITTSYSDFDLLSGTSMSAPVVAGVAALVWSRYPKLTNVELRQLLSESAVDLGAPGRDDLFGWGRVDAPRALLQAVPRGRCGDGRLDPASEVCDGAFVGGRTCEETGWDHTPEGQLLCNSRCTSVDSGRCTCASGRAPFAATLEVTPNHTEGGQVGALALYRVKLEGSPVRGAMVRVVVRRGGAQVYDYELGPSDATGQISDFTPYDRTGMTPATYEFSPVFSKAGGRCHDDQPTTPASYTIVIKS